MTTALREPGTLLASGVVILEADREAVLSELPRDAKALRTLAQKHGWSVQATRSLGLAQDGSEVEGLLLVFAIEQATAPVPCTDHHDGTPRTVHPRPKWGQPTPRPQANPAALHHHGRRELGSWQLACEWRRIDGGEWRVVGWPQRVGSHPRTYVTIAGVRAKLKRLGVQVDAPARPVKLNIKTCPVCARGINVVRAKWSEHFGLNFRGEETDRPCKASGQTLRAMPEIASEV